MRFEVVPADISHVDAVARNARQADVNEAWDAMGLPIRAALIKSLESPGEHYTWLADGEPVGIGGVTGDGVLWFVGTPAVRRYRKYFHSHALQWVNDFRSRYDSLRNVVSADHRESIHWLKRLGFKLSGPVSFGPFLRPFLFFSWEKNS